VTRQTFDGIPQRGVTLGNPNAPVTLVEFADPQCPFCREYSLNAMPELVRKYVRTGKAKMELRLMSFIGPDSVKAARAIEAAGLQNKMWNAADMMYHNQGQENSGYVSDGFLRRVMGAIPGLDVQKALSQVNDPRVEKSMAETDTLATRYGVNSTPSFLVGKSGGTLRNVQLQTLSASELGQAIDAAAAGR
jgi:protein-disulfide isomerase